MLHLLRILSLVVAPSDNAGWGAEECGRIMDYNNPVVKDRWVLRAIALSNRSECYLRMKKWKLAQADAEDALEIDRFVRATAYVRRR